MSLFVMAEDLQLFLGVLTSGLEYGLLFILANDSKLTWASTSIPVHAARKVNQQSSDEPHYNLTQLLTDR